MRGDWNILPLNCVILGQASDALGKLRASVEVAITADNNNNKHCNTIILQ